MNHGLISAEARTSRQWCQKNVAPKLSRCFR